MQEVQVQVVEVPTDGDLHSLAFALNAVHGRPLSLADRRAFAERLLGRHPEWADREIGRRCGLSSNTVGAIRERLEATGIEQPSTRVGAGGYVYNVGTNPKQRPLGELPDAGFGDVIGDTLGRLFTPAERVQQRRIAGYLQRLATALQEQKELQGWEKPEDAAQACLAVLGKEKSDRLAVALGWTARSVLDAAISLGYQDQEA